MKIARPTYPLLTYIRKILVDDKERAVKTAGGGCQRKCQSTQNCLVKLPQTRPQLHHVTSKF